MTSTVQPSAPAPPATRPAVRAAAPPGEVAPARWTVKAVVASSLLPLDRAPIGISSRRSGRRRRQTAGLVDGLHDPANVGNFTLHNYQRRDRQGNLGHAFIDSLAIALPATFIPVLIAAFAAYAFAFMQFPAATCCSSSSSACSSCRTSSRWSRCSSSTAVGLGGRSRRLAGPHRLRHVAGHLHVPQLHGQAAQSVIESAKIDGASHYQTFYRSSCRCRRRCSPRSRSSSSSGSGTTCWLPSSSSAPARTSHDRRRRNNLIGQQQGWNLVTAGDIITMIVPIIVFLALQRYFVRV